jgi:hypothetical protein
MAVASRRGPVTDRRQEEQPRQRRSPGDRRHRGQPDRRRQETIVDSRQGPLPGPSPGSSWTVARRPSWTVARRLARRPSWTVARRPLIPSWTVARKPILDRRLEIHLGPSPGDQQCGRPLPTRQQQSPGPSSILQS